MIKYSLGKDDSPLIADDWDVNLFEDLLVSAPLEAVLAPSGDVAPLTGELLGPVRKADWRDVGVLGVIHVPVQTDHGDVVVQIAAGKVGVQKNVLGVILNMGVEL